MTKRYLWVVILSAVILPCAFTIFELQLGRSSHSHLSFALFVKWFLFWAVGMRLFLAGMSQAINPAFTAKNIFHLRDDSSFPILRELGYANICFGLVGILSLFLPTWRIVSAFASALYCGLAGFSHVLRKRASANELLALLSDLFIFAVLAAFLVLQL